MADEQGAIPEALGPLWRKVQQVHTDAMSNDWSVADYRAGMAATLGITFPAAGRLTDTGEGWVAWNPDTGEEYTPNHPVESGECVEAENIRPSTPQEDVLWKALQEQFTRAEALAGALATPKPPVDAGAMKERCARVARDWYPDEEMAGCDATWADAKHAIEDLIRNLPDAGEPL